jgi:phage baseplate assembly protein W
MAEPPPNVDTSTGVDKPLVRDPNTGYFSLVYTTTDRARVNLENLLRTIKGERPLQPEFGSDLQSILFSQNTEDVVPLVDDAIREATQLWLPEVIINNVEVSRDTSLIDTYRIIVGINFSVTTVPGSDEFVSLDFEQPQS